MLSIFVTLVNKLCLKVLAGVSGRENLFNFICGLVFQSTAAVMSGRFLHFMGLLSKIIMSSYTQCAYKIQPSNQFEPKNQGLYVRMFRLKQVSWVGSDLLSGLPIQIFEASLIKCRRQITRNALCNFYMIRTTLSNRSDLSLPRKCGFKPNHPHI